MRAKRLRRQIGFAAEHRCFKPCGIRNSILEQIVLEADEIEAVRLIDYEGLYQQECADKMGISRTTFSRTIEGARKKIADVLLNGKSIIINTKEL